jgi:hypothetical protein
MRHRLAAFALLKYSRLHPYTGTEKRGKFTASVKMLVTSAFMEAQPVTPPVGVDYL